MYISCCYRVVKTNPGVCFSLIYLTMSGRKLFNKLVEQMLTFDNIANSRNGIIVCLT